MWDGEGRGGGKKRFTAGIVRNRARKLGLTETE